MVHGDDKGLVLPPMVARGMLHFGKGMHSCTETLKPQHSENTQISAPLELPWIDVWSISDDHSVGRPCDVCTGRLLPGCACYSWPQVGKPARGCPVCFLKADMIGNSLGVLTQSNCMRNPLWISSTVVNGGKEARPGHCAGLPTSVV
eukprot:4318247-Amphidinium_carterae.1